MVSSENKGIILYVEDNPDNRLLVKRILLSENYSLLEATNAMDALDILKTAHPDLILMDIRLPYEDGYGALKKIRASERLKAIPIIAVTAEASTDQMNKARDSGFDGFLGKPLDPDKFPDQIRRILAGDPVWEFS